MIIDIREETYTGLMKIVMMEPERQVLVVNRDHTTAEVFERDLRAAKGGVFDFDGTVHAASQWIAMRECMTPECREQDAEGARLYFSQENRKDHDDIDLIFGSIRRLIKSELKLDQMLDHVRLDVPRAGAPELVRSFRGRSMIVSFGIQDYIEAWLSFFDIPASVAALKLRWRNELLRGFDARSVVIDGNKGIMYDAFLAEHQLNSQEVLVMGDALTDIQMMRRESIGVLVVPKFDPQSERQVHRMEHLESLWDRVSAVLLCDSLEPIVTLRSS